MKQQLAESLNESIMWLDPGGPRPTQDLQFWHASSSSLEFNKAQRSLIRVSFYGARTRKSLCAHSLCQLGLWLKVLTFLLNFNLEC